MKTLLFYLAQVFIISGILYAYYHVTLRNNKFHRYNRYYLLATMIISIIIPLFNIPLYFAGSQTSSSPVLQTLAAISYSASEPFNVPLTTPANTGFNWKFYAGILFTIFSIIVLARIIISLLYIRRVIQNNPYEKMNEIRFVNTGEDAAPFSFFNWLFWNRNIKLNSDKGQQVFRHELFHIQQKHSFDVLFMELVLVFYWINPFFHLVKKETRAIHEFLADQFAATEEKKWEYAELLLMHALETKQHLVNPFFHTQIKRRIAMITSSSKPKHQYLRKLMVLPLATVVILLFAFTYKTRMAEGNAFRIVDSKILNYPRSSGQNNESANTNTGNPFKDTTLQPPEWSLEGGIVLKDKDGKVLELNNAKITHHGTTSLDTNIKMLIIIDGKYHSELKSLGDIDKLVSVDNIVSINILKDEAAVRKYGDKGKPGVIEIITKSSRTSNNLSQKNIVLDKIFDRVEIPPAFPGGESQWQQYLSKQLNAEIPLTQKAPPGNYTVVIQFVVDTAGFLHDLRPLTHHGYGMEEEAIRVISKGPRWEPAVQNGHKVHAYRKQLITFIVTEEKNNTQEKLIGFTYPNISLPDLKNANPYQLLLLPPGVSVVRFTFTIDLPDNSIISIPNYGSAFSQNIINQINVAEAGRIFTLDNIVISENGKEIKLPSKLWYITK